MVLVSLPATAQEEVLEVKTYLSQDGVHPGGTIDVAFLLDIVPGWHINAPELADPYLIPCTLMIDEGDTFEVTEIYYPVAETRTFSYSEAELQVYEGKVVLGVRLKVNDGISLGEVTLKASFLYQACDDVSCMAPETLELEVPLEVVSPSKKTREINRDIFAQVEFR